jgi:hypothetical protein
MKIEFILAQKKLATLWFVFVSLIFVIMFLQTFSGKYETKISEAWGWLFPTVFPTLSLIITVFVFEIRNPQKQALRVDRFYFRFVFYLSLFYLVLIMAILLLQPIYGDPIISVMKDSNIYLGPFQAIVTGAMGLFFIKKE